ncbi:uncharacterized protein F4807DRAFT_235760 [Annulohypoxylon truncatum]|uniref:uncharacterized protein n=1 Tax=Annulohypoxylon truncatum TaxID=327061 RepID=UPI002008A1EF|nr:uncharacterized protein F4807DRAFT_235760 [Annulohypoxylon truncatum]KAI1206314.1 hypothetical protein F4807DRAFT_235760 [Annulohypoxylon truncatum]
MSAPAKRYATFQDWTRLQADIMRLYLDEDKTLEEVKSYMEEHHEFFATVSMYKKKFTTWGAFKNLRLDEVLQILHLKKQRDADQKQSLFFIRDREVDHCSLQVYLSRNPSVFAKLEAGVEPSPEAIRDVSCRTPPSPVSPSLSSKRLSPSLRTPSPRTPSRSPSPVVQCNRLSPVPEDMLRALHTYLDQSFESGLWSWSESSCWNTRGRNGPAGLLSAVLDRCITAGLSMTRQVEPATVRRALDVPFAMLTRVFKNPPPIMIPKLVSAAAHLNRVGRGEIGSLLLQFCRDLTVTLFGQGHPLTRFWTGLMSIPQLEQQDAMGRVLSLCVSEYGTRLGEAHPLTIEAYLKYFDTVEREKDPRVQLQSLNHQLSKIDKDFADGSLLGLLKLEHALATCKLNLEQQRLDKAEEALVRLNPSLLAARDEAFRCIWLGYIQCLRGNHPAAESFYKNSVLAAKRTGSRDCVLEALFQLETFFLHYRKPLEAERVRAERFRVLRRDSIIWTDQERSPQSRGSTPGPSVMILHIGSDDSSARWRPSAFTEITEYVNASHVFP